MESNKHTDKALQFELEVHHYSPLKLTIPFCYASGRVMEDWLRECGEIDIKTLAMVN